MRGLADKVVVVAGGGSGIGAATARRLGAEGAAVVVGDLAGDNADAVAAEVRDAGGRAISVTLRHRRRRVGRGAGRGRDLASTAGSTRCTPTPPTCRRRRSVATRTRSTSRSTCSTTRSQVNLRGHLLCTRHALPHLLERGGGALVYTSSAAGHIGEPERPSYAASKAGINSLVRHVASHWGRQGIRANSIAPGLVVTPAMDTSLPSEFRDYALRVGRSPRLGRPDDIAGMVAFLVSDDGEWVNGQVLSVDGGASMRP